MKKWFGVALLLIFAVACSKTQSGQHKTTDVQDLLYVSASGEARVDIYVDLGGLITSTDADTTAGDAPATNEVKIPVSAALKGAQAGASTEGSSTVEGNPVNVEPIDASQTDDHSVVPVPQTPEPPNTGDSAGTDQPGDAGGIPGVFDPDNYTILGVAACDQQMSFHDDSGEESVIQKKCVFDKPGPEYGSEFVVQWSSGNTLDVPDSSSMQWLIKNPDTGEKDYRKYHPAEPTGDGTMSYKPGTPAEVYVGRGDNSTKAMILGKK